jgi:hypothetical protein
MFSFRCRRHLWGIWRIDCMLVINRLFLVSVLNCSQAAGLLKMDGIRGLRGWQWRVLIVCP